MKKVKVGDRVEVSADAPPVSMDNVIAKLFGISESRIKRFTDVQQGAVYTVEGIVNISCSHSESTCALISQGQDKYIANIKYLEIHTEDIKYKELADIKVVEIEVAKNTLVHKVIDELDKELDETVDLYNEYGDAETVADMLIDIQYAYDSEGDREMYEVIDKLIKTLYFYQVVIFKEVR